MNPHLSIIITSHNDANETVKTLASIRETTTPEDDVDVVVIDDCSATPLHHYIKAEDGVLLITNTRRCGCGPSRHIGALAATGDWLLIVDSHMRFTPGWPFEFSRSLASTSASASTHCDFRHTVLCATCVGLDSKHMDLNEPASVYHGATMNFLGPDRQHPERTQVFEAVWLPKSQEPADGQEIPAIMGACYFISRQWFLHLGPTRFLRTWGGDEQAISLKSWLAGGSVRMAKNVRIGHKFLIDGREKPSWAAPAGHVIWSKAFLINTLLPDGLASTLTAALLQGAGGHDLDAVKRMLKDDHFLVAQERAFNQTIFTMRVEDYAAKFGIPLP